MANVTVIQPTVFGGQAERIRCAAYCRVSSSSDDQLNSFAVQMTYYSQKFEHSDTETLVELYADEGISGTGMTKRIEFNRMLADCRRGKIDRIYTKSISRFARNTRDCLKVVRELKSLGITIKFEKEGFDTAQMTDEIMLTVMGSLAQEESVSISQNMRWSVQKRYANGSYLISVPPFGYRFADHALAPDEQDAETVKQIFSWYLSGIGLYAITSRLNALGITRNGKKILWRIKAVRYILSNERYTGDALFQKSYNSDTVPFRHIINHGEKPQYYVSGTNPAIINKADFDRVQQMLAALAPLGQYEKTQSALSGMMCCAECGCRLRRKIIKEKIYWTCRKHDLSAISCENKSIPQDEIYAAFIRLHNKLASHYKDILVPLLQGLRDMKIKQCSGNADAIAMHREIAKLMEQTHVIARLHTKGLLSNDKYLEQTTTFNSQISKLRKKHKKQIQSDETDETIDQIEMLVSYYSEHSQPLTEFSENAFTLTVNQITVTKDHTLSFHLIGGLQLKEKTSAL